MGTSTLAKPKYEYVLRTWGGFYNFYQHGYTPGTFYFESWGDRERYIEELNIAKREVAAHGSDFEKATNCIVMVLAEGYHLRSMVTLHRIVRYQEEEYYTVCEMFEGCSFEQANYHIKHKWYPGHNDYPFGEDFNYEKVTIVSEWITGAFEID